MRERGGLMKLTFRTGAEQHEHTVWGGNSDWIDLELLWIIDEFLRVSPYRLHAAADSLSDSQGAVFTVLSPDERNRIENDREVTFVPLPETPSAPWEWDLQALLADVRRS